jgi:V-type H+-transporting ATPase subunit a
MYGDIGHGSILLIASAWMVWKEADLLSKPQGEIFSMAFKGRYMLLMMSCFAIYCGLLYNDFFATGTNLFGTRWAYKAVNGTVGHEAVWVGGTSTNIYPFGVDPAWRVSDNELLVFNSLKMKVRALPELAGGRQCCRNLSSKSAWGRKGGKLCLYPPPHSR